MQSLLMARKNELKTEEHLKSIADRENGRLKQENSRLDAELAKLKEKRNQNEVTSFNLTEIIIMERFDRKKFVQVENKKKVVFIISLRVCFFKNEEIFKLFI
jgi:hypothetical protein